MPIDQSDNPELCASNHSYESARYAEDPTLFRTVLESESPSPHAIAASTPNPAATTVACQILARGGTAADALVAAQYLLGLVEPQSSGPGGGALVTYWDQPSGEMTTWDGTAVAPQELSSSSSVITKVGIPRTDILLSSLHQRYGRNTAGFDYPTLLKPARRLATQGFIVSPALADAISSEKSFSVATLQLVPA